MSTAFVDLTLESPPASPAGDKGQLHDAVDATARRAYHASGDQAFRMFRKRVADTLDLHQRVKWDEAEDEGGVVAVREKDLLLALRLLAGELAKPSKKRKRAAGRAPTLHEQATALLLVPPAEGGAPCPAATLALHVALVGAMAPHCVADAEERLARAEKATCFEWAEGAEERVDMWTERLEEAGRVADVWFAASASALGGSEPAAFRAEVDDLPELDCQ